MVGEGSVNYACVWTGDPNSERHEWFDPWADNVDLAVKLGCKLLVIGHQTA